jgi:predicted nucleic acid-binding protein
MIVVDTNVVAYLLIDGPESLAAEAVLLKDPDWFAPSLWRSEFLNVLSVHMRNGGLSLERAIRLASESAAILENREVQGDSARILRLVARSNCSAYDCEFVALAEEMSTFLVTSDRKLIREFPEIVVSMKSFANV